MGGNVYSEEARLREAQEVQYERGRNRLASETLLARLRAEHGPEPRFGRVNGCLRLRLVAPLVPRVL